MQNIKEKKGPDKSSPNIERKAALPEPGLWVHWHALSQQWASDMQYYEDELSFFRILIDRHLKLFMDQKNIVQTRTMVSHLQKLENRRVSTQEKISKHVKDISAVVENPFAQYARTFKDEHEVLEDEVLEFVKSFRAVKLEVFKLTGKVMKSGKVNKLLGSK